MAEAERIRARGMKFAATNDVTPAPIGAGLPQSGAATKLASASPPRLAPMPLPVSTKTSFCRVPVNCVLHGTNRERFFKYERFGTPAAPNFAKTDDGNESGWPSAPPSPSFKNSNELDHYVLEQLNSLSTGDQSLDDKLATVEDTFENVISHSKVFAPTLSAIKKTYNQLISEYATQKDEIQRLQRQVEELKNGYRESELLSLERRANQQLREHIDNMEKTNESLLVKKEKKERFLIKLIETMYVEMCQSTGMTQSLGAKRIFIQEWLANRATADNDLQDEIKLLQTAEAPRKQPKAKSQYDLSLDTNEDAEAQNVQSQTETVTTRQE